MPAADASQPALDVEVTKRDEESLLPCEGSYECFAGDPDVSFSTLLRLRLCRRCLRHPPILGPCRIQASRS